MNDFNSLQKKQNRIFFVVCVNFLLFMILFMGAGFVIWKSATLVSRLSNDLLKAEATIRSLQDRIQELDTDEIIDNLSENAAKQVRESLRTSLAEVDFAQPMNQLSGTLVETKELLTKSGDTLQTIDEKVATLDNDVIARKVAEYVLQGLREGSAGEGASHASSSVKKD